MKILEAQSATLTNYEVYTHLMNQKARYDAREKKRRGPGNLETVVKEMLDYLRSHPSPLSVEPIPYDESTIKKLLEALRPYNLTKAEVLMILNLRPASVPVLSTIVEEMEQRFPEETQQQELLETVIGVLGAPEAPDGGAEDGDAMES